MSGHDLQRILRQRLRGSFSAVLADTVATIVLTDGGRNHWTLTINHGRISSRVGRTDLPTTTVTADLGELARVVSGERSGVEAFLAGDLSVRGDLALALQMDGLFVVGLEDSHLTRTQQVRAGGVDTFYLEAGDVDNPPVVLVHGLGATNASMLPLVAALAPNFHVLAPDLPGHGASRHGRDSYAASFLGDWLLAFLEQTCDRPAVLVGNSLGGRTALEAALLDASAVRALVLLCPAVAFRKLRQFVPLVRLVRPELSALAMLPIPRQLVLLGLRQLFADPSRLPNGWHEAAVDEFMLVMRRRAGRVAFFSALRQVYLDRPFGDEGFWDRLPGLVPPALFIWGDRDVLVPPGFARHVERAVPAATSIVLNDCGHVPQFEYPQLTARLFEDFIGSLPDSAEEQPRRHLRRVQ